MEPKYHHDNDFPSAKVMAEAVLVTIVFCALALVIGYAACWGFAKLFPLQ